MSLKAVDAKSILERLNHSSVRKKISFYLSSDLYDSFKKSCGKISASRVIEELMNDFMTSLADNKNGK